MESTHKPIGSTLTLNEYLEACQAICKDLAKGGS